MIKKIQSDQLQVGMYISNLDASCLEHNFISSQFAVSDENIIKKVHKTGIKGIYIDTAKGIDIEDAHTAGEVATTLTKEVKKVAADTEVLDNQIPVQEEIERARGIYKEAHNIMHELMNDIRLGKQVDVERVEPISEQLVESVFRNKDALISLSRIKDKDHYTFMHSVSVAGLMITFSRAMGFDMTLIKEIAIGGMLHDVGKMMTPNNVLNKPDKLDDDEFIIMKSHVVYSKELLEGKPGITQAALDVAALHHERVDGTGYPSGLKGDAISQVGQMSSIVDVYDALTSVRVYKSAWEPNLALKKLLEWSDHHFNPELVKQYIRCLGIYPIGTLVELDSGNVAVVIEQGEKDLLNPKVRIIYNIRKKGLVNIRELELWKTDDRIIKSVSPQQYQINLAAHY
ncbi:MAG: HD-GYP domain-containing protein [Gammaproteobacteria bacterium]|nr:HD-GYP domain-containing protein [Gammaproteobacteria bacterium]